MRMGDSAEIHEVRGAYRVTLRRRNYSPGTIESRMSVVRRWLEHVGDDWKIADRELVESWLDECGVGPTTRYGRVSHLHQFYRWARREGLTDADPTELVERPRLPHRLPRPARTGDVDFALTLADGEVLIILCLMVDAGLRCLEVAGLDWADVDMNRRTLHVVGKGGRHRTVGIPDRLAGVLGPREQRSGRVIGREITACRVSQLTNQYLRSVGISSTAHQLRHLYATRMLAATGGDIAAVQQSLGHASIMSTQLYAQVDPARALDAARRLR